MFLCLPCGTFHVACQRLCCWGRTQERFKYTDFWPAVVLWRLAFPRLPQSTAVDSQRQGDVQMSITLPSTCILPPFVLVTLTGRGTHCPISLPKPFPGSQTKQNNSCHTASRTLEIDHVSREFSLWFACDSCKSFWFQLFHALGVKNQEILDGQTACTHRAPAVYYQDVGIPVGVGQLGIWPTLNKRWTQWSTWISSPVWFKSPKFLSPMSHYVK